MRFVSRYSTIHLSASLSVSSCSIHPHSLVMAHILIELVLSIGSDRKLKPKTTLHTNGIGYNSYISIVDAIRFEDFLWIHWVIINFSSLLLLLLLLLSYRNKSSHVATDRYSFRHCFILFFSLHFSNSLLDFFSPVLSLILILLLLWLWLLLNDEQWYSNAECNEMKSRMISYYSKKSSKYDKWSRSIATELYVIASVLFFFFLRSGCNDKYLRFEFDRFKYSVSFVLHALTIRIEI